MRKLIKFTGYGLLLLTCFKCVDSTLCTSRTIAPLNFELKTIKNGEAVDTIIDSLVVIGISDNALLDSHLINAPNVTNGNLKLAPLENQVTYSFFFHHTIHVDFNFFYQQQAEFLNDACGFIYEYTLDSLTYEQKTFSNTYTIPSETTIDTIYNETDTTQIEQIDTVITEAHDTTIQYGPIIDSVKILNPNITIDAVPNHIEIFIHPAD